MTEAIYLYLIVVAVIHIVVRCMSPRWNRWWDSTWYIRSELKWADLWLGVHWQGHELESYRHFWICLIPCLPIHIRFKRSYK